jgi:hypothetical protein
MYSVPSRITPSTTPASATDIQEFSSIRDLQETERQQRLFLKVCSVLLIAFALARLFHHR